ncbi:hypothetical protein LLEC1_01919 [Akanthomyces lecanii]|uniref:Helicase C-terminal domain-containing protein n=1 Tax=Cordyceps confragosa TaxID=2714763 RepID=A0A179HZJ7_CORDF|nr:hypothetical protein LLEC1_01919 [Akanthomyces lecanii]
MQQLSIRRGMLSELKLSNGETVRPGDGIPEMTVRYVELLGHTTTVQTMKQYITRLYDQMFSGPSPGTKRMDTRGVIRNETTPPINLGIVRKAALCGFHTDFWALCNPSIRNLKLLGDPQARRALVASRVARDAGAAFRDLRHEDDSDPELAGEEFEGIEETPLEFTGDDLADRLDLDAQALRAKSKAKLNKSKGMTPGGVQECNLVRANNVLGGLRFFFYTARRNRAHKFPTDRTSLASTFCTHSPKLAYTCLRGLQLKKTGKRLLIFGAYPATCLLTEALLNAIGVRTVSIRSENSPAERSKIIKKFNDPKADIDAMVIPSSLGSFGMNLQNCCHHGIILEEPPNTATLIQILGRIARMGQKNRVQWEILYGLGTFDGYRLSANLEKHVKNLAAEAHLDERITAEGEIATICLYELVCIQFGLPFNAYIFSRVPWDMMDEPATRDECKFYSALAQSMFANPRHAALLQREKLEEVVKRWKVGGPVTRAMLTGKAPLVKDPVQLRHYNRQRQSNNKEATSGQTSKSTTQRDRDPATPTPKREKRLKNEQSAQRAERKRAYADEKSW